MSIWIDDESAAERADVLRLVTTRNDSGEVIDESYVSVYGDHWVDIQPLSDNERIVAEQLKLRATHLIFPETDNIENVSTNDFYRDIAINKLYRIVEPYDFRELGYFRVWDGNFGIPGVTTGITKVRYVIEGVGPGTHTFGAGLFLSVPTFDTAPDVWGNKTNDSGFYITSVTASGFTLVDRGTGEVPVVTVYIFGTL